MSSDLFFYFIILVLLDRLMPTERMIALLRYSSSKINPLQRCVIFIRIKGVSACLPQSLYSCYVTNLIPID